MKALGPEHGWLKSYSTGGAFSQKARAPETAPLPSGRAIQAGAVMLTADRLISL
jgi:hypothetical protein